MNHAVKINVGNVLFNKDMRIEELGKQNMVYENQVKSLMEEVERLSAQVKKAEQLSRESERKAAMVDLDLYQMKMKLNSLEVKHSKDVETTKSLENVKEGNTAKIEALQMENSVLRDRQIFLESENARLTKDIKVVSGRLDKCMKQVVEQQEVISKKESDILTYEKLVKQKNGQIDVLLRKDKNAKEGEREAIVKQASNLMESKIDADYSLDKQITQKLQNEIESLKRKIKNLNSEYDLLGKENTKLKEDNFYLVTRLKNMKK